MMNAFSSTGPTTTYPATAGVIMIEMAVVLWALILISVGTIDFGMALEEHSIMQQAAASGAREAAKLVFRAQANAATPRFPTVISTTNAQTISNAAITAAVAFLQQADLDPENFIISISSVSLALPESGNAPNPAIHMSIARRADRPRSYFYTLPTNLSTSCASSTYRVHSRNTPVSACVIKPCSSCTAINAATCQSC